MEPVQILTVCTGNICRSPFLERALQAELDSSWGRGAVVVSSAGTGALVGSPMEPSARALLEAAGYSADGFEARDLTASLVAQADLVLTATRGHRGRVASLHPKALRYVFSFREFADLVEGVPEDELRAGSGDAAEHVRRVVGLAGARRGARTPLSDEEADIIDPYRRPQEVFDQMSAEILKALPTVARALGRR